MSSDTLQLDIDLAPVSSGADPDVEFGPLLRDLTDALTTGRQDDLGPARSALIEAAGEAVTERAIAVCATFQMMNRLLDGVGAPVSKSLHPIAAALGFRPEELPR